MVEATVDDVREEVDTVLEDAEISALLDRVEREWQREYDATEFIDTTHIADFEALLTALRIAEGRDRRAESEQSGRTSTTYEISAVDALRKRVRRADPGTEFGHPGGLVRDTDRYVNATSVDES
jgi:hypothetical protein